MVIQVISIVGALAILLAYAANQVRWTDASNLLYQLANLLGSGILTVVAVIEVHSLASSCWKGRGRC